MCKPWHATDTSVEDVVRVWHKNACISQTAWRLELISSPLDCPWSIWWGKVVVCEKNGLGVTKSGRKDEKRDMLTHCLGFAMPQNTGHRRARASRRALRPRAPRWTTHRRARAVAGQRGALWRSQIAKPTALQARHGRTCAARAHPRPVLPHPPLQRVRHGSTARRRARGAGGCGAVAQQAERSTGSQRPAIYT